MKGIGIVLLLVLCAASQAAAQVSFVPLDGPANDLKNNLPALRDDKLKTAPAKLGEVAGYIVGWTQDLAIYALGRSAYASLIEDDRLDKQVGTSASSAGSTGLVSHGSTPSLIGLAVEGGALYQSVNDNVLTLRINPAGLARAVAKQAYWQSLPPRDVAAIEKALARLSASASFNVASGTTPGIFSGGRLRLVEATARYEALNKRDPRDRSHAGEIAELSGRMGDLVATVQQYSAALDKVPAYRPWAETWAPKLFAVDLADDDAVRDVLFDLADDFKAKFGSGGVLQEIAGHLVASIQRYRVDRDKIFDAIDKSSTVSFEYGFNRMRLPDVALTALPTGTAVPDLSTARVIVSSPVASALEVTFNASVTAFNSPQEKGRLRDAQFSGSVDFHVGNLPLLGKPTVTFALLGAWLHQQPFGVPVTVEGISTADGTIGVFQAKVTVPTHAGLRIPISVTIANRSEFNTSEREVRGAIGFTFDFDRLFLRK